MVTADWIEVIIMHDDAALRDASRLAYIAYHLAIYDQGEMDPVLRWNCESTNVKMVWKFFALTVAGSKLKTANGIAKSLSFSYHAELFPTVQMPTDQQKVCEIAWKKDWSIIGKPWCDAVAAVWSRIGRRKIVTPIKRMSIASFCKLGYLQEANRLFFHPRGLALEVTVEDDGNEYISGIQDHRDSDSLCLEYPIDIAKIDYVALQYAIQSEKRRHELGCVVQPETEMEYMRLVERLQPIPKD